MLDLLKQTFAGKRVFLTGHTGFKGAWMLQILSWLGADVKGFSLAPEKPCDLYNQIDGDRLCYASIMADIRDFHAVQGELIRFEPHFVFHLAAQSLVKRSYEEPVETFAVNAMGTAHVLQALRGLSGACVGVMVTTDKVYENPERGIPFIETDNLGGYDPYSASKAATEIVIDSYRRSFFHPDNYTSHLKSIAAARAGNVIGGGDYSDDRIVPDIVRAIDRGESVTLRNPKSIRPWQHVLEPLGAYLLLAAKMGQDPVRFSTAFNFGPQPADEKSVEALTQSFLKAFGCENQYKIHESPHNVHEANLLLLDSSKAKNELGWQPKLNAGQAIDWAANWYADQHRTASEKCMEQIIAYFETNEA
ncbi:MAG: CDP-glucose 4,6-dehydratase [Bacteroidetes bacterium]|nr:CDP-glucose 4,6-dehydratase [Bacteroidota bacterium]MBS1740566.1 CDP-glucose 4,6-dehydratase [Bacteroidota bacterium]